MFLYRFDMMILKKIKNIYYFTVFSSEKHFEK